jgi:hypothetical protein
VAAAVRTPSCRPYAERGGGDHRASGVGRGPRTPTPPLPPRGETPPPAGLLPPLKAARERGGGSGRTDGRPARRGPGALAARSLRRARGPREDAAAPGCRYGAPSLGHPAFSSGPGLRVADMTTAGRSPLAPLLETLDDASASPGAQIDAYLTLTR